MKLNQNETGHSGLKNPESTLLSPSATAGSGMVCKKRSTPRSAFTLTELLVVITIIAILASLITVAVANALRTAKRAAISLELNQIEGSFEDIKNEYGAYPPNAMLPTTNMSSSDRNRIIEQVRSDWIRMFKKAFPRADSKEIEIFRALISDNPPALRSGIQNGMNGSEAVVFWLGGFSSDPQYPLSGPGGPSYIGQGGGDPLAEDDRLEERNWRFEFDLGRLGPRNDSGIFDGRFIVYDDPTVNNRRRRINLWRYAPGDSDVAAVYLDVSRQKVEDYDIGSPTDPSMFGPDDPRIFALKKYREGVTTLNNFSDAAYVNQGKFQVLHCGIDDAWGDFSIFSTVNGLGGMALLPSGPFIGDIADTLGNFGTDTLADEQE